MPVVRVASLIAAALLLPVLAAHGADSSSTPRDRLVPQDWLSRGPARSSGSEAFAPPESLGSVTTIVGPREPGRRMVVTGRVLDARGRPKPNVVIGVYQTDLRGFYGENTLASTVARLHGWVRTDARGWYELRTIHPGAYPSGGTPAHIHFVVNGYAEELRFADPVAAKPNTDPARREWITVPRPVSGSPRDTFGLVRPVTVRPDGTELVVRNFRLR